MQWIYIFFSLVGKHIQNEHSTSVVSPPTWPPWATVKEMEELKAEKTKMDRVWSPTEVWDRHFTWGGGWERVWWRSSWRCTVWRWTGLKAPALCEAFRWGHTDWPRHLTNTSGRQKEEKRQKKFTFKIQLVLNYSTTWKQSYSQGE